MDISKMGNRSWSEPGLQPLSSSAVANFENDIADGKVTNSVGDLLQLTRERTSRQFVAKANTKLTLKKQHKNDKKLMDPLSDVNGMKSSQYQNVHERPPRRVEVSYLENELKQMVKTVMSSSENIDDVAVYQPHKEKVMLIRNRIYLELGIEKDRAAREPWLESIVKSECLKDLCDEVSSKLTDMLSVSSAELGNVLRKLRYTYDQSFLQAVSSWKELQTKYCDVEESLHLANAKVDELNVKSQEKEVDIRYQIDSEVEIMKSEFEDVQRNDKEKIKQLEQQMDQMSGTLKNLNAIFKTMQSDVDAARSADTFARCSRLEREVADLEAQVSAAARVKNDLDDELAKTANMTSHIEQQNREIENLKAELNRRDITVTELMERETLRNAEIEKLTRMAAQRQENDEDLDLDPVASSVLCIKCKKSLDDISSIRDAILGKSSLQKIACQAYRILLPNNKGKKPHRSNSWLKACMRSILTTKMVETMSVIPIGESVTAFPSFVYAWFEPAVNHATLDNHSVQAIYQRADENRWGLYYGAKILAKEDAEAKLFWGLLDEVQGEDGLVFICHCLSVVLSIGGPNLWKQFGVTMNNASINANPYNILDEANPNNTPANIWLDLDTATAAARLILVRALESQIVETLDAIESLKVVPDMNGNSKNSEGNAEESKEGVDEPINEENVESDGEEKIDIFNNETPTHIDLFVWLRVMMQRFQDEQCHRHAAVRLMFDTASMGALSGSSAASTSTVNTNIENPHVYFPQFIAVVKTLYPAMSVEEIGEIYSICYREGETKVTATVFAEVAEKKRLFSKSLKLSPLPLFLFEDPKADGSHLNFSIDTGHANRVRGQIGSLVHAHFTIISKEVESTARKLPQRWKAIITDASESVRVALKDHFVRMKLKKRNFTGGSTVTAPDGSMTKGLDRQSSVAESGISEGFIDGIQPFIQYHRLLTLLLMVKSFSENSLLPSSFLTAEHDGSSLSNGDLVNKLSFKNVENVISTLENSVFAHSSAEVHARYSTVEAARRNIILRRIQEVFKGHMTNDIAIPRSVRMQMRPGYLRGTSNCVTPLKSRRVYIEPWALQALIAKVYSFKIDYDVKAARAGFGSLDLSAAVVALHLKLFNVPDVSERMVQDLCLGMQTYMHGLPRVRMFACFLGCGEVEEPFASELNSNSALSTYINLLLTIHRVTLGSKKSNAVTLSVRELFPCSVDPSSRIDKRDVWNLPLSTLAKATEDWSRGFKGFKEGTWSNALNRVQRTADGLAEVDDFLWVIMQVWAKAIVSRTQKCEQKAKAYCVKEGVVPKKPQSRNRSSSRGTAGSNSADEASLLSNLRFPHAGSVSAVCNMLNSIQASSISQDIGVGNVSDVLHCSSVYAHTVSKDRHGNFKNFQQQLRSCVLWDATTSQSPASSSDRPDTPEKSDSQGKNVALCSSSARLHAEVLGAIPSTLSIRLAQVWWTANKDGILSHIDIAKNKCDGVTEQGESEPTHQAVVQVTPIQVSENLKQLDAVKKLIFQIEKLLLESNSSSNSGFGQAAFNIQRAARSDELWSLIAQLNGIINEILKTIGYTFPLDSWKSGRKLHLDRASAYLMQVQTKLS